MTDIITFSDPIVELIDHMGTDIDVAYAAWVSSSAGDERDKEVGRWEGLVAALAREHHSSPFEMCEVKIRVETSIMVVREWFRHRTQSYNEQCLSGDTIITRLSPRRGRADVMHKKNSKLSDLWRNWHEGVPDSLNRTRKLASCQRVWVRSFDEQTLEAKMSRVLDIKRNGVKVTYEVTTESGKSLRSTMDHKYFTPDGWRRLSELKAGDFLYRSGQRRTEGEPVVPPRLRQGIQIWVSQMKPFLVPETGSECYLCETPLAYDDVQMDHVVPVVVDLARALDVANIKPVCRPCHRAKTDSEQKYADRTGIAWSVRADKIVSISDPREEETYDLVLEDPHHNFLANGLVVHNSGRYTKFEPVFYVPGPDRPLINIGTSLKPEFVAADEELHEWFVQQLIEGYEEQFRRYEEALERGISKEMARLHISVGIKTTFYAKANLLNWLKFISRRTSLPNSTVKGHPQYEIAQLALEVEKLIAEKYPVTMKLFNDFGRVAP